MTAAVIVLAVRQISLSMETILTYLMISVVAKIERDVMLILMPILANANSS